MNVAVKDFQYKTPQERASETLAAVMDDLTLEKVRAFHDECRELVAMASSAERSALLMVHEYIGNMNAEGAQEKYERSKEFLNAVREQLKKIGGVCRGN